MQWGGAAKGRSICERAISLPQSMAMDAAAALAHVLRRTIFADAVSRGIVGVEAGSLADPAETRPGQRSAIE